MRKDPLLFGPVTNRHDVHMIKIGAALAPVAMREDQVTTRFAARLDLASWRNAPVEKRIEPRHALPAGARLDMLEECREPTDDLPCVELLRDPAERREIDSGLRRPRFPQAEANLVRGQLAFQREEHFPLEVAELNHTDLDHFCGLLGAISRLDHLSPNMSDPEREDAARRHQLEGLTPGMAHQHPAMFLHRSPDRHFQ